MSIEELGRWMAPVAMLLTIANFVWVWVNQSRVAAVEALEKLERDVEAHDRRIQSTESEIRHLPTKDEISSLKIQMTDVLGQLRVTEREMSGVTRTLRRLEDHQRGTP